MVVEIKKDKAIIEIERSAACKSCGMCLGGNNNKMRIEVLNQPNAEVGDRVSLDIQRRSVLIAYSTVFLLPLFFLVSGFFLGEFLVNSFSIGLDPQNFGFFMGLIFLGISYLLIRKIDTKVASNSQFEPHISRVWKKN
ncbi:SoxR reducing system RseC family protein [Candidatus Oleimmundimicrobium sp.]|uniref:SoxR reducing system RseC family protein n=1 Tax=Candidatus Oleimmundimicrobium sp. TaxID=3060597 RepID=UPI0027230D7E|nr:SoxR reducing system RseC family protein [Candidatus Oleimmundimicrobium sp.]MDO8886619.1 SoxR reducing system RseC family protein [Candidatus Oleimmundimicrobium sp.]